MFMILVARCLERVGDNTVDIAEQVVFVVTGLFREMADRCTPTDRRSAGLRPPARAAYTTAAPPAPSHEAAIVSFGHGANDRPRSPVATNCLVMRARPPQIVAFGGGGFSMEWGNPLLDDHVLALTRRRAPAGVLPADRQRRRRPLRRPLLSGVPGHPLRAVPHLAVSARDRGGRSARASAGPGSRSTSAAAAWCRCWAPGARTGSIWPCTRRGGPGVVLCGGSAGSLCWFSQRCQQLSRGAGAATRGARLPALEQRRALRRGAGPQDRVPRRGGRRDAARLRGGRRRGAAFRRHRTGRGRLLAPEARARLRVCRCADGQSSASFRSASWALRSALADPARPTARAPSRSVSSPIRGRAPSWGARSERHPGVVASRLETGAGSWRWAVEASRCRSAAPPWTGSCCR